MASFHWSAFIIHCLNSQSAMGHGRIFNGKWTVNSEKWPMILFKSGHYRGDSLLDIANPFESFFRFLVGFLAQW
jgi:hypothetical protein